MKRWLAGLLMLGGCQAVEIPVQQPVRVAKVRPLPVVVAPKPKVTAPIVQRQIAPKQQVFTLPPPKPSKVSTEYGT